MATTSERKWVTIVEDDPSMSQALERILRLGGYKTTTYPSAEAVLANSGIADTACVILDVRLPGLSGFELHERLIGKGTIPPVIFITAFDDPDARKQAHNVGAFSFLAKPFSGRVLLQTVRRALDTPAVSGSQPRC